MQRFQVDQLRGVGKNYLEFLRRPDMSAGIYRLAAGATDPQQPHTEDEVYFVVSGSARFQSGDADFSVSRGDFIFVPASEPHRFHDITEALEVLVFFGPAEGTRK